MWKMSTDRWCLRFREGRWLCCMLSELLQLTHDALSGIFNVCQKPNQKHLMSRTRNCAFSRKAENIGEDDPRSLTRSCPTLYLFSSWGGWWSRQYRLLSWAFLQEIKLLSFQGCYMKYECVTSGMQQDYYFSDWLFVDMQERIKTRHFTFVWSRCMKSSPPAAKLFLFKIYVISHDF